jgi:hypothetical protein
LVAEAEVVAVVLVVLMVMTHSQIVTVVVVVVLEVLPMAQLAAAVPVQLFYKVCLKIGIDILVEMVVLAHKVLLEEVEEAEEAEQESDSTNLAQVKTRFHIQEAQAEQVEWEE